MNATLRRSFVAKLRAAEVELSTNPTAPQVSEKWGISELAGAHGTQSG